MLSCSNSIVLLLSNVLHFIWHYIDVGDRGATFWPTRYMHFTVDFGGVILRLGSVK